MDGNVGGNVPQLELINQIKAAQEVTVDWIAVNNYLDQIGVPDIEVKTTTPLLEKLIYAQEQGFLCPENLIQ